MKHIIGFTLAVILGGAFTLLPEPFKNIAGGFAIGWMVADIFGGLS